LIYSKPIQTDMKKKSQITAILIFILTILACGNRPRQTEPSIYDEKPETEQSIPDTTAISVQEEEAKVNETPSKSANSSSLRSHSSHNDDYMRGFDPASEDDMEDNGISRYMENNDEEGWD